MILDLVMSAHCLGPVGCRQAYIMSLGITKVFTYQYWFEANLVSSESNVDRQQQQQNDYIAI